MSEIFQEEDSGSGKLVFRPNASFLSSLSREMVGHGPAVLLLYNTPAPPSETDLRETSSLSLFGERERESLKR